MKKWQDDTYTKKARKENFVARSVYKLQELEKKEALFKNARLVVDLGSSPGSWCQWAVQRASGARIIAVDLKPMEFSHPKIEFFQMDFEKMDWDKVLSGQKADVVMSDMAPHTTGISTVDIIAQVALVETALHYALGILKPEGYFVCKVFMGEGFDHFSRLMQTHFKSIKRLKPESTRKQSREIFFIASGLKKASP